MVNFLLVKLGIAFLILTVVGGLKTGLIGLACVFLIAFIKIAWHLKNIDEDTS